MQKKFIVFIGMALVSIAIGLLPHRSQVESLFSSSSYYFIFALFFIWLATAISVYRSRLKEHIRHHYPILLFCLALTAVIFICSPPRFKILADETNLIGVSKMMHENRSARMPIEGISTDFGRSNYLALPDKRPILFSFLTSLAHALFGYAPTNGFILNFVVSCAILFLFYLTTARWLPNPYGWIAVLLAAGAPIYMINITSSGFEGLNLLFLMLYFLFLLEVFQTGGEVKRVELVFLTTLLLAYCRYESAVLIVIMIIMLLPILSKTGYIRNMSYLGSIAPVFFIPILWQRRLFMGISEFNKIGHESYEFADKVFSLGNLASNFDDNTFVLLGLNPDYGFTPWLSITAIIGLYLLIRAIIRKESRDISLKLFINALVPAVVLFLIISAYFWGNFGLTMDNRLSLVFLPFLVWSAVYALYRIEKRLRIRLAAGFVFLAAVHLMFFWPYGSQQRLVNTLSLQYEYHRVLEYLRPRYPRNGSTLIIAEQPNLYIIHNYSSMRFNRIDDILEILVHPNTVDHMIALQKIDRTTGRIAKQSKLNGKFKVTPLKEISLSPELAMRISSCELVGQTQGMLPEQPR